mmetsp:Transcript_4144/g.7571  ORF Transcript_4144/g.7571 Transcript_4144/m.7571 type:complete len:215 (-) Transcript_4144:58-702(-)|eukprot:CAMPEP_0184697564 /NCGR_PEP_ID=MMETSP0313-20130426/4490_1 /TAXON_ID=2792 /ORGANISM="Porphyridium aerugineum, Strain SAG 1380-2" /LENGTH=214 /DNA_ID=CAMNT_0027156377 /DNA_START=153 /DNA_END=797 /DNA_ORIENTATION=+
MAAFVSGFSGLALKSASVKKNVSAKPQSMVMMAKSRSVPFLDAPKNLPPSTPGSADFDPLGFSDYYDPKFLREAEIKHGRICMLASLGWVYPELFPGAIPSPEGYFTKTNPLEAIWSIPTLGVIQLVLLALVLEAISWNKVYMEQERGPGEFGFDPLQLGTGSRKEWMQSAEIKNGRLAMIGVLGFYHQSLLTGTGVIEQLKSGNYFPTTFPLH